MACGNNFPYRPINSTGRSLINRRRKLRNSVVAFRLRGSQKKHSSAVTTPVILWEGFHKSEISARKLAASLWQLRFMEVSGSSSSFPSSMSQSQRANGNPKITLPHYHNSGEKFQESKDKQRRPITILRSRNALRRREGSKEVTTKRNLDLNEASNEFTMIHSKKLLEVQKLVGDCNPVVKASQEELLRAQKSINKLKAEHKSLKKVEIFLHKFKEERTFWKRREHQKIEAMLDDLKDELARERGSRERTEFINNKLVNELAEANLLAKEFMTYYEKEKKEKEMIEELCNELATQIGEDKAKLKAIQSNSIKICEEVEEERKMMQIIDEWREGRAQMKLVDAQLFLEDKYNQMVKLISFLQMFLLSKGAELDNKELEDAKLIKQAIESVNIQQIVELSYDFSNIVPIFDYAQGYRDEDQRFSSTESTPERGYTNYLVNVDQHKDMSKWKASPSSERGKITISSSKSSQHKRERQRNSTDNMTPRINRGMKGCIEWPRGIRKSNSMVFHLKEKMKSQKSQMQTKI